MAQEQEPKKSMKEEIGKESALEATLKTEGGQRIMGALKKDIVSAIDEVCLKYKSASHSELIAIAAKLAERLSVFRLLHGSSRRKKIAIKDLDDFMKENPDL